jgi:sulfite reductase (ferredoxin)
VEQYQLWLGGTPNLTQLAAPYLERMPLVELETTLEPLLLSWKSKGGRQSFGQFVSSLGAERIQALLPSES